MSGEAARAWRFAGALCGLVVVADQAAKALVERNLTFVEDVEVLGPLELTLSHNTGVAFGLAKGGGSGIVVLTALALGVIAFVFSRYPTRPGLWVGVGLLAGGAFGNLADRVRVDAVTDYVQIGSWPAFNLADVAVIAGVAIFVLSFLRERKA